MFLLLLPLVFAEPEYKKMKEGEVAPFDGRLFNDEAIATMISKCELNVDLCQIHGDLECNIKIAKKQYEYDILEAELNSLKFKHEKLLEIKEQEIKILKKQAKPQLATWTFIGGFVLGTGASLATYYFAKQ